MENNGHRASEYVHDVVEFDALDTSKLKPRKIFLKNVKYECSGSVVVCIETTCSYTSDTFKGVYIGQTGKWKRGDGSMKFEGFFGKNMNCPCENYNEYKGKISL